GRELQLGEETAVGYRFFIAETQQQAIEQARPYFEEAMKFAAPLGLMRLSPEQVAAVAEPRRPLTVGLPTRRAAGAPEPWLGGPAEQLVAHLRQLEEPSPGRERINLGAVMGMPGEVFKAQLTKFAEGVMPHFVGRTSGA